MLELCNVSTTYPELTLNFNVIAKPGEITALIGPSGAGKSTLLALIGGFAHIDAGDVLFNGSSIKHLSPAQRPITTLFQEHNLFWHLSVYQNIAIGLSPSLKLSVQQRDLIAQVAQQVGLTPLLKRMPNTLSGGQQQRVGLARSLARRRPILLLDEPFSALDPALRFELLTLLRRQTDDLQLTCLLVTHHPEEAARVADALVFIDQGQVIEQGTKELLTAPQSDALSAYLGQH
ncbi:thiamine ABC transporter ATP-binding protein [Oceanisphaera avium]|uniref:Thiamine ABC transporter ATP-binding protein n=1 Tax=Oceanisphaera avium TaxID=1903694 RepID=A0A1Y0CY30_9GAMM|nr:thiamine ABC transporter ATP-binding protein [Oceanisphaera avium]ART80221.1 thiamine ABC transporter ATP-binding protein [Oceanisphaera avium]